MHEAAAGFNAGLGVDPGGGRSTGRGRKWWKWKRWRWSRRCGDDCRAAETKPDNRIVVVVDDDDDVAAAAAAPGAKLCARIGDWRLRRRLRWSMISPEMNSSRERKDAPRAWAWRLTCYRYLHLLFYWMQNADVGRPERLALLGAALACEGEIGVAAVRE